MTRLVRIAPIVLVVLALPAVAEAALPPPGLTADTGSNALGLESDTQHNTGTTGPVLVADDISAVGGVYHGFGSAGASFGLLTAASTVQVTRYSPSAYSTYLYVSSANAVDTITLNSAAATGFITFDFTLNGSGSTNDFNSMPPLVLFQCAVSDGSGNFNTYLSVTNAATQIYPNGVFTTSPVPYVYGTAIDVNLSLVAEIQNGGPDIIPTPIISEIHYEHTVALTGITAFDQNDVPISFTSQSVSGTTYPVAYTPAPEPASLALFASALPLLLVRRRMRR